MLYGFFGMAYAIFFLVLGAVQVYVGFLGIEYHLGTGLAWLAIFLAFGLRILLPLTIGTFFGALNVLGWPWFGALALAAPGLLFAIPSLITSVLATLSGRRN